MKLFTIFVCSVLMNIVWGTAAFAQESLLANLQQLRKSFPTPMTKAQTGELLTWVAQSAPGWVLLSKPAGNNCPAMGTRVSCDYIVHAATGQGFDVLLDSEGAATPRWNKGTHFDKTDRFVSVGTANPPVEPPVVVVPPVVLPSLPAELDAILKQVLKQIALLAEALKVAETRDERIFANLTEQIAGVKLDSRPFPNYHGGILGFGITLRPE
jgi:hypothetical protein